MEIAEVTCFFLGSPECIRTYYVIQKIFLRQSQHCWNCNRRKQCGIDGDIQEINLMIMNHGGE